MKGFSPQHRRQPSRGDDSSGFQRSRSVHETHFSAIEDSPRTHARLPCPDEDRRWSQGSFGAAREGPRATFRLTHVAPHAGTPRAACYRLRGTGAFETVFKTGVRHDGRLLQLIAAPATQSPGRVGYVIGRKMIRRAVDRNRLRRRLRERVRKARPAIEAFDIIVRVKRALARDDIPAASDESAALLERLLVRR